MKLCTLFLHTIKFILRCGDISDLTFGDHKRSINLNKVDFNHLSNCITINQHKIVCLCPMDNDRLGKIINVTDGTGVLSTMADADLTNLAPCSHEEADTRLLLRTCSRCSTKRVQKTVFAYSRH